MRISDWSSDVCSSDLLTGHLTDRLSLIGGFRFTSEQAVAHFDRTILPGAVAAMPSLGGPAYVAPTLKATDTDLSYKLGLQYQAPPDRSEKRRVGKECVSTCRSRWWPDH